MNIESYSFALLTAVVGMGTVFFFLVLLSVMMLVIRRLFDAPVVVRTSENGNDGAGVDQPVTTGGADVVDSNGLPRWVIAGVLAYIAAEETEYAPYSGIWTQRGQR